MKRGVALILLMSLLLTLMPVTVSAQSGNMGWFVQNGTYRQGMFRDVEESAWYVGSVSTAYELGLMKGQGQGKFAPGGNVTLAEAIAMAVRLHSIYTSGKDDFKQGNPWYQVYVDYAVENDMLKAGEFSDYNKPANRAQMVHIFASALPENHLKAINTVNWLPDVNSNTPYHEEIFRLYRAGVLTGNDGQGTFAPYTNIQRSQAAAIIARMALPSLRKTLKLDTMEAKLSSHVKPLGVVRSAPEIKALGNITPYGDYWMKGRSTAAADLSQKPALAYSLTVSDVTTFGKMPEGYSSRQLIEWGKAPGLNVDILHKHGFTGKGAVIAYVDQPAGAHGQYNADNIHFTNHSDAKSTMHGPAVLSLLSGKEIGTAPGAEVYFYGHSAWLADQTTHAACLYAIIEQNKKLPEDQKITMVAFSDNIDSAEKNAVAFKTAVEACEKAGIMVWFCAEYGAASYLPMSDRNNYQNLVPAHWGNYTPSLVYVPTGGRTTAATEYGANYIYWSEGGLSWAMPYVFGLYAIATEIDPSLTQDELRTLIKETAYDHNSMAIVNPVGFVSAVLRRVGRDAEAQMMLDEAASRQKYLYAVMDTASMDREDLESVGNYLASITDAVVLVADASSFKNAETLYAELQADAAARGGQVAGVQIFGTAGMVPAFEVQYKVQMPAAVDDGGVFLTDLFYGNFANQAKTIANGYNVMDHFAQKWKVNLTPNWPVVRLPLTRGEFAEFLKKYEGFATKTGLKQPALVSFSNPIFASSNHVDDMGAFLQRVDRSFKLLNVPYRLYGNQEGQYPVTSGVLGGFTTNNLEKENDAGIMELLINSHGQWDNIDQCYFVGGKEQRRSFVNMKTINQVLDGNPYYLDCWTCNNGTAMGNNLTTTALNGKAVGVFSATAIISNNGVDCNAGVKEMERSNFYYFYYSYLQALHAGKSRSQAFNAAQKAYAKALIADSANGIRGNANYQFNLCNLLSYHNFGVLEPNANVIGVYDAKGYIAQAGQSVPKETKQPERQTVVRNIVEKELTDGIPVGEPKKLSFKSNTYGKGSSFVIHSYTAQKLDNGRIRMTLEYTAPAGMNISVFDPPDGEKMMMHLDSTGGGRESQTYDLDPTLLRTEFVTNIYSSDGNDRHFASVVTATLP